MQAFRLTAANAELFFEVCHELKADTEEMRLQILGAMVQLGRVESIVETPKTKEEYIKHLSKHFNVGVVEQTQDSIGFKLASDDQSKGDL